MATVNRNAQLGQVDQIAQVDQVAQIAQIAQVTQIAMIAGPRNISTTMMRAFEARGDCAVYDEPFYGCYLKQTRLPHPMRDQIIKAMETDWQAVIAHLSTPLPNGITLSFEKHIAFHFTQDAPLDWLGTRKIFLLIRNPRAMVASYVRKYDHTAPLIDSLTFQRRLFDTLSAKNMPCPIIDSDDILRAPKQMLSRLCEALSIPFDQGMLSWSSGLRASDGIWAPHWYDAVASSTGFKPYQERKISLAPDQEKIAQACYDDYLSLIHI